MYTIMMMSTIFLKKYQAGIQCSASQSHSGLVYFTTLSNNYTKLLRTIPNINVYLVLADVFMNLML